jgi:CDP-diacylglycerol pyrophosphatase
MGAWTLALAGAVRADGSMGFYLLADRANPAAGDPGSAEDLQDHACRP